jgi:RNA polymerase sigma-70 factor (ECF subfamily)
LAEADLDVQSCLERVREGDEDAARALMAHLHPLVLKLVRAHLPRRSSEEDLVQTVFMKVFTKLDQYAGAVPMEHWVSRIAVNTCLNQIQRERVRPELRLADLSEEEEQVVQTLASTQTDLPTDSSLASRELVEKLLARLKPEDRLVITLLHLEGKSVEETSQVTGWNATLVKVRAFRARSKMKKHLETLLKECPHESVQ